MRSVACSGVRVKPRPSILGAVKGEAVVLPQREGSSADPALRLEVDTDTGNVLAVQPACRFRLQFGPAGPQVDDLQVDAAARPGMAGSAPADGEVAAGCLEQADVEGVALHQGIDGEIAKLAPPTKESFGSQEEEGDKVGVAFHAPCVPCLEPEAVVIPEVASDLASSEERGVADDGVEAGVGGVGEHLGECEGPV